MMYVSPIVLFMNNSRISLNNCNPVYAITDDSINDVDTVLEITEELFKAGINLLQYRNKNKNAEKENTGLRLKNLCKQYNATFIINDDIDLAINLDADGVHLGKDDTDLITARNRIPDKIIGISCYNDFSASRNSSGQRCRLCCIRVVLYFSDQTRSTIGRSGPVG